MKKLFDTPNDVDVVGIRREISEMNSEARLNAKPTACILCGRAQTSFCNSHSVPQMALRSIADNGVLFQPTFALGFDERIIDISNGVKKSGTFNYICNDCDNSFFRDYENPETIVLPPTDRILAEIAVKNMLLQLSKVAIAREWNKILQRKYHDYIDLEEVINTKKIDYVEIEKEVHFHQNIRNRCTNGEYQILFRRVLPYVVPIAVQSAIAVTKDLEGVEINDIHNMDPNVRMQYLQLAIFPLDGKSLVLAFFHKRDKNYRKLSHQFNSISEKEALENINYYVFKYAENCFFSKIIKEVLTSNETLQKLRQEVDEKPRLGVLSADNQFGQGYIPICKDDIPNLLSSEWTA